MIFVSTLDLYLKEPQITFFDKKGRTETSEYAVIGCPYDSTTSRRPGTRFAPLAIRLASYEIESFSLRALEDFEDVELVDLGDIVPLYGNVEKYLARIEAVIKDLKKYNSRLKAVIIGGEHTISLAGVKACGDIGVVVFDAHMDLRDEYPLGDKVSHATVSRRISEVVGASNMLLLGVRAFCKDEYQYAKDNKIKFITSLQIIRDKNNVIKKISDYVSVYDSIYLSIDIDVLDPAFAPGVTTPEPEGISATDLLDIIYQISETGIKLNAVDLVEVTPPYDHSEVTSSLAAKVLMETMLAFR